MAYRPAFHSHRERRPRPLEAAVDTGLPVLVDAAPEPPDSRRSRSRHDALVAVDDNEMSADLSDELSKIMDEHAWS